MSQPYGQQPGNQGYGQQPPPGYGQQPQPGYGSMPAAPPEYTGGPIQRPGTVTTAAVLSFVQGGISLICTVIAMIIFAAVSSLADDAESSYAIDIDEGMLAIGWIVAVAGVIGAGLLIWAGVKALSGTAGQLMLIASAVQIVLCIVWLALLGGGIIAVLLAVMPIIALVMYLGGPAKQFEASKRGGLA
jgi:hypothetical protein